MADELTDSFQYDYGMIVAIPSRGIIDTSFMVNTNNMLNNMPKGFRYTTSYVITKFDKRKNEPRYKKIDVSRQALAEYAIEMKAKYILFLDDDIYPPEDALRKLIRADKDIICGLYYTKEDDTEPVVYEDFNSGSMYKYPKTDIFKIGYTGLGIALIKTEVFKKLPKPWFQYYWKRKTEDNKIIDMKGEDFYFFHKCQMNNIDVHIDPTVYCAHLDLNTGLLYPDKISIDDRHFFCLQKDSSSSVDNSVARHAPGTWEKVKELLDCKDDDEICNFGCGGFVLDCPGKITNVDNTVQRQENFHQLDLNEDTPFPSDSFDYSIAMEVIEHLENPRQFIRELKRVTKKSIILTTPNLQNNSSKNIFNKEGTFSWFRDSERKQEGHITPIFDFMIKDICSELGLKISKQTYNDPITKEVLVYKIDK